MSWGSRCARASPDPPTTARAVINRVLSHSVDRGKLGLDQTNLRHGYTRHSGQRVAIRGGGSTGNSRGLSVLGIALCTCLTRSAHNCKQQGLVCGEGDRGEARVGTFGASTL
jgi:hypothetical protein